jgi:hypothetical protein
MFRKSLLVIVVLLLLAAFGVGGSARADGTPTPEHGHMEGTPEGDHHDESTSEGEHNADHGPRIDANGAAVKIISPQDGEVLDRPTVIVRVETTSWPLGEGKHWHVYVNGKEQGMSQGNSPALQARDLQPGENVIEAVLSNELHQELNATDKITVRYDTSAQAAEAVAPANAPGLSSGVLLTLALVAASVVIILAIGFAVTRRKKA